jgi:hypothetical protein
MPTPYPPRSQVRYIFFRSLSSKAGVIAIGTGFANYQPIDSLFTLEGICDDRGEWLDCQPGC